MAAILNKLVESPFIQGAFWGIGVAVLALILLTIREMWQKCTKDLFFYFIGVHLAVVVECVISRVWHPVLSLKMCSVSAALWL